MRATRTIQLLAVLSMAAAIAGLASSARPRAVAAAPAGVQPPPPPRQPKNPLRNAITARAPSVARADLLACQQLSRATVQQGRDLNLDDFKKQLSGTWVRQLTWYGVPVETESALYFDLTGNAPSAMMFDQSNVGKGPLAARVDDITSSPERLARTTTLTFLDCDYSMVDTYFKISDELVFEGVQFRGSGARPLEGAFAQLSRSDFFDRRVDARVSALAGKRRGVEMLMPSLGAAFFGTISVRPTRVGRFAGATLQMDGEYRFSHFGATPDESDRIQFSGKETAQFFMEGDAFVASKRAAGGRGLRLPDGWNTACDASFDIQPVIYERVVLEPGR